MLRKCVTLPTSTLLAAVAVQKASSGSDPTKQELANDLSHYQCKSTELPIYVPLHSYNKPKEKIQPESNYVIDAIKCSVRIARIEVQKGYHLLDKQKENCVDFVSQAKEHALSAVDYLNEPQNILPRTGAVAIGGLSGFIFAARGGFIKKIFYTTIGAGAIASLCYPRQAEQIARDTLFEARKGFAIAYNFVKGVKPGDEMPVEPINKFPTSLEDIKLLAYDLYDEAKEALFSRKK